MERRFQAVGQKRSDGKWDVFIARVVGGEIKPFSKIGAFRCLTNVAIDRVDVTLAADNPQLQKLRDTAARAAAS